MLLLSAAVVGPILSAAAFAAIGYALASAAPLLLAVAAIMGLVGLLAAFGPTRRGAAHSSDRSAESRCLTGR